MEENIIPNLGEKAAKEYLWYTYFGSGGAGAFAFIWICALLVWIIEVIWKG